MNRFFRDVSLVFSAGALGGLLNGLAVWAFGALGIAAAFGVQLSPTLTPEWMYPRLVWGGIWGALFLLPLRPDSVWLRGLIYSLGPTLVMLFVVFPAGLQKGVMGLELGVLMPAFVVFYNVVWGVSAAWWLRFVKGRKQPG